MSGEAHEVFRQPQEPPAGGTRVVKRSRVLETEVEADVPYEETRLARKAAKARPRLALVLLVGAAGLTLETVLERDALMLALALAVVVAAYAVRRGKLGGVVAAALVAVLAALIPFALLFVGERTIAERVILSFVIGWGLAMLPDVLTLVRDAELQYAYGRWARREG